ncbi:3-keto-steroid reductase [Polyplosphaeria fusca]|uniref:3-keto-steroid reductase n=1 Tax=Polyplosphaeria fusca TaxID=682080 RepID=A0A9P4RA69_9PLEO|nr:3-keto-steroid reductase [Polyplosphaeria fusca]
MPTLQDAPTPDDGFYVLITGANSGLGLGIGCRLIDEFLHSRPQSQSLILIVTTRDKRKGDATVKQLRAHLHKACQNLETKLPGIRMLLEGRVFFRQEILDLTNILNVQRCARSLKDNVPKLDVVIFNAGIGAWVGMDWLQIAWCILTSPVTSLTWAPFKISGVGWVTKPQLPPGKDGAKVEEPPLGDVFAANFFGHYLLGHYTAPLLARYHSSENRGRIIWVGSLDAYEHSLDLNDFQYLTSEAPYEASKRMTDLMCITSTLPSTDPHTDAFLAYTEEKPAAKPRIYLAHPGICGTSIFPLNFILDACMYAAFFIVRLLGSQWHPVTAYKGATSMVWLALAKQSTLDAMEEREGVGKWGSATDRWGEERVERTEIEGWGWGGVLGERKKKYGRSPFAKDLTEQGKREFEETGKKCWEEMEKLRLEWEKRLEDAGVAVEME